MTLTRRDRGFICAVGFAVVLTCAIITTALPAAALAPRTPASYTIVSATGLKPTAYCPSGTDLLGGGGEGASRYTYRVGDVYSKPVTRPYGQPGGWEFYLQSQNYSTIDTTSFAICAKL